MKIMGISQRRDGVSFDDIQRMQLPETRKVWELQKSGFLREIYFDPDKPAVVVVIEASSLDEARATLGELPMVEAGLIDFDLTVLGHFGQLGHLFADGVE